MSETIEKWWIISAAYLYDSLEGHFTSDLFFCQIYQLDYLMMDFISNVEWFSQV